MHLHDEITRIADMDGISRVDVQGFALADVSVVTREVAYAGVETALGPDGGTRLPGQAGINDEVLERLVEISIQNAGGGTDFHSYANMGDLVKDVKKKMEAAQGKAKIIQIQTKPTKSSPSTRMIKIPAALKGFNKFV